MILRDKRAAEIMDSAVLAGTSQHGDDLQLVVERRDKNPTTDSTPSSGGVTSTGVPPAREQ
jgi:hypothetical protein